jgi:hypothetical protein
VAAVVAVAVLEVHHRSVAAVQPQGHICLAVAHNQEVALFHWVVEGHGDTLEEVSVLAVEDHTQ